jgi:hypothetical protein
MTPDQIMKSIESLTPEEKKALTALAEKKVTELGSDEKKTGGRRRKTRKSRRRSSRVPT